MKFCIQIFFTSGQSHTYFMDYEDLEEVDEYLFSLREDKHDLVYVGNGTQSFLINKKNVILFAASEAKELPDSDQVETICCKEGKCQK